MDRTFLDNETEQEFQEKGYVVRPLLDDRDLKALQELHDASASAAPADFYATVLSRDFDHRWRVSEGIRAILQAKLQAMTPNHKLCLGLFVTKRPRGKEGRLPLHQDWWIVDNTMHRAVHFWCPLIDVDAANGCLKVVPGVHRFLNNPYPVFPARYNRTEFHPVLELLETEHATRVPMFAGSTLIYDQRILHGSDENFADQPRVAVNCIMIPESLKPRLYYGDPRKPSRFDVLEVDDMFLCRFNYGERIEEPYPEGVSFSESIETAVRPLRPEDLDQLKRLQTAFDGE